jgi:asparagine synthase (glutamine-hydrolysing)
MSGICGLFRFQERLVSRDDIHRMNRMRSDGSGYWYSGSAGLAHQAFHITFEPTNDFQPCHDQASKLVITADCRLDNRAMLCREFNLIDASCVSDSFLILHAWQKWGKNCPQYLLGEFAVAIWDEREQELVCFTDHSGSRTFYYYHDDNLFAFATDIRALHALPEISRKPNLHYIAACRNISYLLNRSDMTCYENVFKASPRTLFSIKNKRLKRYVYWQPDIQKRIRFASEEEYIEAFQDLFSTIVRDKLRSHGPVITLHSGGLDSSSITAMAAHLLAQDGKSLTALSAVLPAGYEGEMKDESHYIRLLQLPNLHIQPVLDTWRGPFDGLDDPDYYRTGFHKSSRYYLYKAFATAASAQGARIILDGCFGEKGPSFHGNGYYAELLATLRWRTLLRETQMHARQYDRAWWKIMLAEGLMPFLPAKLQGKLRVRSDIAFLQSTSFVKPAFIDAHVDLASFRKEQLDLNTQYPSHRYHQHQNMNYLHAPDPRVYDDSGQPVHFSYPYNDKRMLEFCLAMPGNLKVRNGYKRYAIRSGMRGLMPDELRFRTTKEPFSPDYHDRYNRQLAKARDFVAQIPKTPLMREIVDIGRLEEELKQPMQTNRCSTKRDFMAMQTIPFAVYLLAFLATF